MSYNITSLRDNFNVYIKNNFIDKSDAINIFNTFEKELKYNTDEMSKIKIFGKEYKINRKQVAYGDMGTYYEFSGTKVYANNWNVNNNICNILNEIRRQVELYTGYKFNFVFINRYKDGNDYIGYHMDKDKDLKLKYPILGVSLGAEREIYFNTLEYTYDLAQIIKIKLENGSLFSINYPTNKYWKHSIPKNKNINSPRISLTFRNIIV